jgi:cyclomaltodextrinase / maltogenic alpha-amylase / neopullulanase
MPNEMQVGALALACALGAACAPGAPPATADSAFTFRYVAPPGAPAIQSVAVPGTFNGWSTSALPMTRQADGSWQASTVLPDDRHEFKFFINGTWPADMCRDSTWGHPAREYRIHDGADCAADGNGGRNAIVDVRSVPDTGLGFRHDPLAAAHLSHAAGRLSLRFLVNAGQVQRARVHAGGLTSEMHLQMSYRGRDVWRVSLPTGTRRYSLALDTPSGERSFGPFDVGDSLFRDIPWVASAVGYQIFPERFRNGDRSNDSLALSTDEYAYLHPSQRGDRPVLSPWNGRVTEQHCCHQYFGGDLQGVIDGLDHLQALGVTLIYFNPLFHAGSAHGYDTWDYLHVDPALGTDATLALLLRALHARGMRAIWDFVPNHVGVGHPHFLDAVARGPASPYWRWFSFKVPPAEIRIGDGAHYDGWWGYGSLPELNTREPDVMRYLMDVVTHWLRFGFDGIRVDVPGDIDNRREFFREFRRTARRARADAYLVGEVWQRNAGWLQGDEFDALMNYAVGQDVIERYVTRALPAGDALHAMAQLYAEYPEASTAMQFNVISSHDNARLLTKVGGGALGAVPGAAAKARQRMASALLFALPGVPVTFQGDECAFLGTGGGREENRYPLQWDACDVQMRAHYRQLAHVKRTLPALASPAVRIPVDAPLLTFVRGEPGAGELLVAANGGAADVMLPLPPGEWADVFAGTVYAGQAPMPSGTWRYVVRR